MKTDDILTFLETAPEEIRPWAEEQKRKLTHPEVEAKPSRFQRVTDRWLKPVIMAAAIFAIIFGVWYVGKPPEQPEAAAPHGQTQMGEPAQQQMDVARMAELTAQVEADPSNVDARLELGVLLLQSGDLDAAEEQWVAAAEEDPERVEALYNLGFLYMSKEPADNAKAREAWQKVLEIEPDFPQADIIRNHMPQE